MNPHNEKYIAPFALKEILHVLSKNDDCCSLVNVLGMDRTFFRKLTLLHEMNNRTVEDVRSRQSRHIYDLIMIYKQNPDVVTNLSLLEDVRTHKRNTSEEVLQGGMMQYLGKYEFFLLRIYMIN